MGKIHLRRLVNMQLYICQLAYEFDIQPEQSLDWVCVEHLIAQPLSELNVSFGSFF